MLRYLKAAFWVREKVPLLGDVPVNALMVAAFGALGVGHPAFWLLGLLGETAFLWALSASSRFRKLVDAQALEKEQDTTLKARYELVEQLSDEHRERLTRLRVQLAEIQRSYAAFAQDDITADSNLSSLRDLEWVYLKLLIARQHLLSPHQKSNAADISAEIEELEKELGYDKLSPALRTSKEATLELLRKRLDAARHRIQTLEEIQSDLERIETQFQLTMESAAMRAKPADMQLDLDLASRLITTPEYFGSQTEAVTRAEGG